MTYRPFNYEKDHPVVAKWWEKHGWPVIPGFMLPPVGIVATTDHGEPMAAGWLYQSDSPISWMEWIVGDPDVGAQERGEALDVLIEALKNKADEVLKPLMFTSVRHEGLIERLKKHGFQINDGGMTNMIRNGQ